MVTHSLINLMPFDLSFSSEGEYSPLIEKEAIPSPHFDFRAVRYMVYRPILIQLMDEALKLCLVAVDDERSGAISNPLRKLIVSSVDRSRLGIISRVLHLMTLQIHWVEDEDSERISWRDSVYFDAYSSEASRKWRTGRQFFQEAFVADSETGAVGLSLLKSLSLLWRSNILRSEVLYKRGLEWILRQYSEKSPAARTYLDQLGISFERPAASSSGGSGRDSSMPSSAESRRAAAMEKAKEEARKRVEAARVAFAAELSDDSSDDDTPSRPPSAGVKSSSGHSSASTSSSSCIVCKEGSSLSKPLGLLCFLQPSHVLKNLLTPKGSSTFKSVYRVVGLIDGEVSVGCLVYKSRVEMESASIARLAQGTHIFAEERIGRWIRIAAPVHGWFLLPVSFRKGLCRS